MSFSFFCGGQLLGNIISTRDIS